MDYPNLLKMAEGMSHRQTKKYLVAHVFSGVFFRDKKTTNV